MPRGKGANFDAMSDVELRQFRLGKNREIAAIREEIIAAGAVFERKRAEADAAEFEAAGAERAADAVATVEAMLVSPGASASSDGPRL